MPLAARRLVEKDRVEVAANVPTDPLFGDDVEARFEGLRAAIRSTVQER